MLERLRVTDFAVARDLQLRFSPGLTVFTGETGAGKSLVVDALAFVLGARRGREVIAAGAERALVEATFVLDGETITVERSVGLSGRSSARLQGEPASQDALQALGARAADIHGQAGQLAILRPAEQLAVLDAFAGLGEKRQAFVAGARALRALRRRIEGLQRDSREHERLIARLEFEAAEIAQAALVPGEDERLRDEVQRLANAGRLLEDAALALEALEAPAIAEAVAAAGAIARRDPSASAVLDAALLLESAAADLGRAIQHYRDGIEENPERLAAAQERLDLLARLRRKYGETLEEVIAYGEEAAARLAELTAPGASLETLLEEEAVLVERLAGEAALLSRERRAAASRLTALVTGELEALGMARARLACGFAAEDTEDGLPVAVPDYEIPGDEPGPEPATVRRAFTESGIDRLEFLASFNPGETPRPLAAVASGGETSRFLLALVTVLGAAAPARTVVFDEVDEGVGGRAGSLVGQALRRLAQRHQVLCVTHLPQVAAFADQHLRVAKASDGSRTWTEVHELRGEEREHELAAMLGGISEATLATARELREAASG